jgi:hypothetical protein
LSIECDFEQQSPGLGTPVRRLDAAVPPISAEDLMMLRALEVAPDLTGSVEQGILARTFGRIRDLRVEVGPEKVVLRGWAPSYYTKQLAQTAAMDLTGGQSVVNAIEVGAK